MANVTVANVKTGVIGDLRYALGTLTLSAAYAAGGDTISPGQVKMRKFSGVFLQSFNELGAAPAGAKNLRAAVQADGSAKIQAFVLSTNVEVTAAPTDQSAITGVPFIALGRS